MPELGLIGFVTVYKLSQGPCKGLVVPLSEVSHVPPYTGWGGGASGGELQQGGISRALVLQVICFVEPGTLASSAPSPDS